MRFKMTYNRIITACTLALCLGPGLWASGRKAQIETSTAEGGEIWQNEFDITERKTGKHNIIVYAKDRAGNEAVSGPFNLRIDPNAGLPTARVVYPDNGTVIRQDLRLIGVASGRFGVERVTVRIDDGAPRPVEGTDYWSLLIDGKSLADGRHTLYTQAFDAKGTSGPELSVSFIMDKSPPVMELLSHKIGDLISGNITVRGRADDPNGIKSVSLSTDGVTYKPMSLKTKKGETWAEFSFPVKTKGLNDGAVVYYVRATDNTGSSNAKPYLFFVDNVGPELDVFTPEPNEDVYGKFMLSGRIVDSVGLSKFFYEWGGTTGDIPIHPGDPFWAVDLEITPNMKNTGSIKITAVDKSGNATSITKRFDDKRKVKQPSLVIDYPSAAQLNAMPQDFCIYGYIEPGFEPEAVIVEGISEEFPALPSFRISNEWIPQGRSNLKLTPRAADGTLGTPVTLRINKTAPAASTDGYSPMTDYYLSPVTVTSPAKYSWFNSSSITLEGQVSMGQGAVRLEYRFNPEDDWRPLSVDDEGNFSSAVSTVQLPEGPVHLELRTIRRGEPDIPVYHPVNRAVSVPDIRFVEPAVEYGGIHGFVTVLCLVDSTVPIKDISCSLNGEDYNSLQFNSKYGKAWFNYFCDFNSLHNSGSKFTVRVTDATGAEYDKQLSVIYDASNDEPVLILNSPEDGEIFTTDFHISGVAFDDAQVAAVYWRLLGPKPESIPPGPESDAARAAAAAFAANPDIEFSRLATDQSFDIMIPLSYVIDGEYTVEVYAEDIYGTKSEVSGRVIKISTAAPETEIISPIITQYNRKAIQIRGKSSDANGIALVYVSMDNGITWQRAKIEEHNEWTIGLNTTSYKDGIYSALIRAEDNYGVTSFTTAMINIDNTPPELILSEPVNGARVGTELKLMGRVQDIVFLKEVNFQIINGSNADIQRSYELPVDQVILQTMDMSGLPEGEYIVRGIAVDLAGNESFVSRKIVYTLDDTSSEVAIFNPMPGMVHAGSLYISGTVTGAIVPPQITLLLDEQPAAVMDVDRYGVFHYEIPEERLNRDRTMHIMASYDTPAGVTIASPQHTLSYSPYGPTLSVDSHKDGDMITGRPYLSGRAWVELPDPAEGEKAMSRKEKAEYAVKQVLISYDNGRSFKKASGGAKWKYRLETWDLPLGPLPVLIRAEFANGDVVVRRVILTVDTNAPTVATISPQENSTHRDNLIVYGTATDDFELASVDISLRPGDKAGYSVPQFIQGLYLDANVFGATYADFGLGLSFFGDNVKLQFQVGWAPSDEVSDGGRFTGIVAGGKIIANVLYLPFDYFFGPDWSWYSMSLALGANFSFFTMDEGRDPLFMGAVLAQWEFIKADMSYFFPKWKYCKNLSLYLEPILWFASSDVNASAIFRVAIGARMNLF